MDDIVKAALAKWPNVPHCYGWLGLDARGNWYMRDDQTQARGPFVQAKGSLLRHEKLIDFIQRNYEADAEGRRGKKPGPFSPSSDPLQAPPKPKPRREDHGEAHEEEDEVLRPLELREEEASQKHPRDPPEEEAEEGPGVHLPP